MKDSKDLNNEAIGRPAEWSEGRYQQTQKPRAPRPKTVPENADVPREPLSTPVTRRDYE